MTKKLTKRKLDFIKETSSLSMEDLVHELMEWTSDCASDMSYDDPALSNRYCKEMCKYLLENKLDVPYNRQNYAYDVEKDYNEFLLETYLKETT